MVSEIIVDRPQYIEQLKKWQSQTDLIKIVTGVRRCGKSKLFYLYQFDLIVHKIADDNQIININLEDRMLTQKIGLEYDKENFLTSYDKLLDYIVKHLDPEKMNYVFIDEIQLLRDWQIAANTLRLQDNVDLYLTGSNAYMFSSDLANQLGGRYVEIKMQPLSFKEYFGAYSQFAQLNAKNHREMQDLHDPIAVYSHYIKESGFPQTLKLLYDKQLISDYLLDTVYLNTIQKDVVNGLILLIPTSWMQWLSIYLTISVVKLPFVILRSAWKPAGVKYRFQPLIRIFKVWRTVSCYISASGTILKENNI